MESIGLQVWKQKKLTNSQLIATRHSDAAMERNLISVVQSVVIEAVESHITDELLDPPFQEEETDEILLITRPDSQLEMGLFNTGKDCTGDRIPV